jgi:hypothetical protein
VQKAPEGFTPVIRNNVCVGPLRLTSSAKFEESGNLIFKTAAEAGFVDAANFDFDLKAGSPCIDKGVDPGKFGEFSLTPERQYVHPAKNEKRPADGKLDVGACEFAVQMASWAGTAGQGGILTPYQARGTVVFIR